MSEEELAGMQCSTLLNIRFSDGNNRLIYQADGSPAQVKYSKSGKVTGGYTSVNGELSASQALKMLKSAQVCRVAELLQKADQAVVPSGMPLPKKFGRNNNAAKSKGFR